MKFARLMSVAVVAMFAFSALFVAVIGMSSTDAETEDYSYNAYVSFNDLSQEDFETIYSKSSYYDLLKVSNILDGVFNTTSVFSSYGSSYAEISEVKFDSISVSESSYSRLSGTEYSHATAQDVEFKNISIKVKITKDLSSYISPYSSTVSIKEFEKIIAYLGTNILSKGTEITIVSDSYRYSESTSVVTDYLAVPDQNDNYVEEKTNTKMSRLVDTKADVSIGNKSYTADVDQKIAYTSKSECSYSDSSKYSIGTYCVSYADADIQGYSINNKYTVDGNTYGTVDDVENGAEELIKAFGSSASKLSEYDSLPTGSEIKYCTFFSLLPSDDTKAAEKIAELGGKCDKTEGSAEDLIDSTYNSCKSSSDKSLSAPLLILLVTLILIVIIVLIVFIIIRKRGY